MLFKRRKERLRARKFSAFRNFSQFGPDSDAGIIEVTFKNLTAKAQPVSMFQSIDTSNVRVTTTGSGGYGQLTSSIISKPFVAKNFRVLSSTKGQLSQPFVFTYSNERGTRKQMTIVPSQMANAYQNVPTEIDSLGESMIVDSDSSIDFTLLPNEEVTIIIQMGKQVDETKSLNGKNFSNFSSSSQVIQNLMSNQALNDKQYGPGIGNSIYQGVRFWDTL